MAADLREGGAHMSWGEYDSARLEPGDFYAWPALVRRAAGAKFEVSARAATVMEWRESYSVATEQGSPCVVYWDEEAAEDQYLTERPRGAVQGAALAVALTPASLRTGGWCRAALADESALWHVAVKFAMNGRGPEEPENTEPVQLRGRSAGGGIALAGVGLRERRGLLAYLEILS